jgi:hypothetical protein
LLVAQSAAQKVKKSFPLYNETGGISSHSGKVLGITYGIMGIR